MSNELFSPSKWGLFVLLFCSFVCLFIVIKPENPYFNSRLGLEVNPLGEYPLGPRNSSCGPTKFRV